MNTYNFNDLVGNIHVLNVIKRELENHTMSNFLIFEGSPGTGKSTCAEIIALQKTCDNPQGPNPCLRCPTCKNNIEVLRKSNRGKNLVKYNMASMEVKDKLQNIINEVFKNIPPIGESVYIFEEFHTLTRLEQSSLLEEFRTLDQNVFIIATTTKINEIIPEMRSRANIYTFNRLTSKESKFLIQKLCNEMHIKQLSDNVENIIINQTKGIPRDLIKVLNHAIESDMSLEELEAFCGSISSKQFTNMFRAMKEDPLQEAFAYLDDILKEYNVQTFAEQLVEYILNVTFYLTSSHTDLFKSDEKTIIRRTFTVEEIFKINRVLENLNTRNCTDAQLKMTLIRLYQILSASFAKTSNTRKASKQAVEAAQKNAEVRTMEIDTNNITPMGKDQIKNLLGR